MTDSPKLNDVMHVLFAKGPDELACDTAWISLEPGALLVVPMPDPYPPDGQAAIRVHVVGCKPTDADDGPCLWLY